FPACHPRKSGFGIRVKIRGSTSERESHGEESRALANTEMRNRYLLMSILALMGGVMFAASAIAVETPAAEHEGVPLKAAPLVQIGKFAITNSMLVTWIVAAAIIIFAQIATRRIQPIPS